MALLRADDFLKNTQPTATVQPKPAGGFISASEFLSPQQAPVAPQAVSAPTQPTVATPAPVRTQISTPTAPSIIAPITAQAPALRLPEISAPTKPRVEIPTITPSARTISAISADIPGLSMLRERPEVQRAAAGVEANIQRKEQLKQREKELLAELGQLQRSIGLRTEPSVVRKQQELQAELQDVSAELRPGLLGVAEGLSELTPIPTTFTETQQKRREVFGIEPSTSIEEARGTGEFKAGSGLAQLAGNVVLYQGINQALQGLGTASKLGQLLGGSKLASFAGTQAADLLVDTIAQSPREFMDAIEQDQTLAEGAKDFLKNRAIDVGINLLIGGFSNRKQIAEIFKKADSAELDASIKRVASENSIPEEEVRGIASGLIPTQEELAKRYYGELDDTAEIALRNNVLPENDNVVKGISETNDTILKSDKPSNYEQFISKTAPKLKAKSGFRYYTTDFFRNIEDTFGKNSPVKSQIVDPFLSAKKRNVENEIELIKDLKANIVDKLGINKSTKLSAAVQQYGEKRLPLEELKKQFPKDWEKVVEAEQWFRKTYDKLLDEVNAVRVSQQGERGFIPKRQDYFRHFRDMSESFAGLKNLFETPANIDPNLAGISEFTKPKSKWLSFAQERLGGKFTDDAVGGMLEYIPAATYAKHIDPEIANMRSFINDLRSNTKGELNNFISYMDNFTNDLSGKTNFLDRPIQELIGRRATKIYKAMNSRVKANAVMGNLSSAVSQLGNIPNAIATIKNPVSITKGMFNTMGSVADAGHKELYKQSGFLQERYADKLLRSFDKRIIDQPKKLAAWLLEAGDEVATKFIWSSAYEDALRKNLPNPVEYADDLARKMVAGRGIGEVPLAQKSMLMQTFAPFTIEVGNALKVQKELFKNRDLAGIALLYVANNVFNGITEKITGNRILFDPIEVIYETKTNPDISVEQGAGRLMAEVLTNTPLGNQIAGFYPEYGVQGSEFFPTRDELFGGEDPTRFGTGLLIQKMAQNPLKYGLLPWGGGQVTKTVGALKSFGVLPKEGLLESAITGEERTPVELPGLYTQDFEKLKTPIELTPENIARGLAFGTSAIPEVREFYDQDLRYMSERQTDAFVNLVEKRKIDSDKLFNAIQEIRRKGATTKEKRQDILEDMNFTRKESKDILTDFYNYKR